MIDLVQFLLPLGLLVQAPLGHLEVLNVLPVLNKINVRNSSGSPLTGRKRQKNNWQVKHLKMLPSPTPTDKESEHVQ